MSDHRTDADEKLRTELLAMAAEDHRVRGELLAKGALFHGYNPHMAEVHHRNAQRLAAIMNAAGWPGRHRVGRDGADAAWLVLQHSIGDPAVMRRGLALVRRAAPDAVDAAQAAMLEDRVRVLSGLPQWYGTQFDWDESGEMSPRPIEQPDDVDERRRAVGLPPLVEQVRDMREGAARAGGGPPPNPAARRQEIAEWERSVGWHR